MTDDLKITHILAEIPDLDPRSECVGRNGTFGVDTMFIQDAIGFTDDGMISLGVVSKSLHRVLNAGITISAQDMDRLALEWIRTRGVEHKAVDADDLVQACSLLKAAEAKLDKLVQNKGEEE